MPKYVVSAKVSLLIVGAKNAEEAKDLFREELEQTALCLEKPNGTLKVKVIT